MRWSLAIACMLLGLLLLLRPQAQARALTREFRSLENLYEDSQPRDSDLDGLTEQGELRIFQTNPNNADTDGDGYSDGVEVMIGSDPNDARDPATGLSSAQPQPAPVPWPWYINRATGIASYLLLFLMIAIGITITTGVLFKVLQPTTAWELHRAIGLSLLVSVVVHVGSLLFDQFMKLGFLDVLVPFATHYRPVLVGLGILGFYLLLLILWTSIFSIVRHPVFWRTIHPVSFIMFTLIFLHALLLGTDAKRPWVVSMYWATAAMVVLLVAYRLILKFRPLKYG